MAKMAAKKLRFSQRVTDEYHEKCPELSRIMVLKHFDHQTNVEDSAENFQSTFNACKHCGTIFTGTNCEFRIKPKRKRSKKKKHNLKMNPSYGIMPKSSNFLQILCHFCGWKTRHIGATTKQAKINNSSLKNYSNTSDMLWQTPRSSEKTSVTKHSTPQRTTTLNRSGPRRSGLQNSSGNRKKTKSRLKELLAKEKLESDQKTSSPSLINFLASM